MAMQRHDYAFPFRIDPASRQAQRTTYAAHVEQMVIQLLLTSPGERADLPEFGCGLRALIFAPNTDVLAATTQMLVQRSLERWLSDHLIVLSVEVPPPVAPIEQELLVRVTYMLRGTGTTVTTDVVVV
jgi:phage baseplate assembly protein W